MSNIGWGLGFEPASSTNSLIKGKFTGIGVIKSDKVFGRHPVEADQYLAI